MDRALLGLLAWYREMGVADVVGEQPVDWLGGENRVPGSAVRAKIRAAAGAHDNAAGNQIDHRAAAPAPSKPPYDPTRAQAPQPAGNHRFPTKPPDQAVMAARDAARSAASLDALHDILAGFEGCALKATARNLCFFRGAAKARVMIIGEAPGREEDREGRPFVGRAGILLDKMLAAIDLDESSVHITNIVYWRPPGNRTPTPQEAEVCRPFLERQVELVAPEFVLLLGGAAAKQVLGATHGIMRLRGRWRDLDIGKASVKALPTLHPAYLLRTPAAKRLAWRDLLALKERLAAGVA